MAAILIEPVVAAVTAIVESVVSTAVAAAISAAIAAIVATAIQQAVQAAVIKGMQGTMISDISDAVKKTIVTEDLETALSKPVADLLRRRLTDTVSKIGAEVMRQMLAEEAELLKKFSSPDVTGAANVKKVLDDYSGRVLRQVLPDELKALMGKVADAVKAAGEEAKEFTSDTGTHITLISLIPFYGWVEGPIELAGMKEKCLTHFYDLMHSQVSAVIKEYQPDLEAVTKAAKKMANSKGFKDALTAAAKGTAVKGTAVRAKKARLAK